MILEPVHIKMPGDELIPLIRMYCVLNNKFIYSGLIINWSKVKKKLVTFSRIIDLLMILHLNCENGAIVLFFDKLRNNKMMTQWIQFRIQRISTRPNMKQLLPCNCALPDPVNLFSNFACLQTFSYWQRHYIRKIHFIF